MIVDYCARLTNEAGASTAFLLMLCMMVLIESLGDYNKPPPQKLILMTTMHDSHAITIGLDGVGRNSADASTWRRRLSDVMISRPRQCHPRTLPCIHSFASTFRKTCVSAACVTIEVI